MKKQLIIKFFVFFLEYDPCGKNQPAVIQNEFSGHIQSPITHATNMHNLNCTWFIKVGKTNSMILRLHKLHQDIKEAGVKCNLAQVPARNLAVIYLHTSLIIPLELTCILS